MLLLRVGRIHIKQQATAAAARAVEPCRRSDPIRSDGPSVLRTPSILVKKHESREPNARGDRLCWIGSQFRGRVAHKFKVLTDAESTSRRRGYILQTDTVPVARSNTDLPIHPQ
jgi:hypothetical protein